MNPDIYGFGVGQVVRLHEAQVKYGWPEYGVIIRIDYPETSPYLVQFKNGEKRKFHRVMIEKVNPNG
jgi:allophanate hydrolase subunit 2